MPEENYLIIGMEQMLLWNLQCFEVFFQHAKIIIDVKFEFFYFAAIKACHQDDFRPFYLCSEQFRLLATFIYEYQYKGSETT